jgi:hypothetical protein
MARIRTVKPDFFRHEGLFDAERTSSLPLRLAFAGLWTSADREGRFAWSPRTLKLDCLPHDDVDFGAVLDALCKHGFIQRYEVDGREYGSIPSWQKHQHINQREAQSALPAVPTGESTCTHVQACGETHVHARGEGKGKEGGNGKDTHVQTHQEDAAPNGAQKEPSEEVELFKRGKIILGPNAGGLIAKLLKSKKGSVPLARAIIELASTKENPQEYIGAVIRGPIADRHGPNDPHAGIV